MTIKKEEKEKEKEKRTERDVNAHAQTEPNPNSTDAPNAAGRVKMKKTAILSRLMPYLFRHPFLLSLCVLLTICGNLLALAGPYFSGRAIDAIELGTGKVDLSVVLRCALIMAALYVSSGILSYTLSRLMILVSRRVVNTMRRDVFNKLTELPVGFFDTNQTGDILSRISYDIDTINTSLSNDLVQIFASSVTVIGALAMMISISKLLVLVFAFTVPLSIFLTKKITGFTRPLFRKRSAKLGELNGFVEEMISGQKTLRAYGQEQNTIDKLDVRNDDTVEAYYRAEYYGSMTGPSVNFINNLSLSLVSFFGAILFLKGGITIGNISTFVLYSRQFSGPINEFANILGELQSAFSAAERVFRLLDEPPEPADAPDALTLAQAEGNVELDRVRFGYTQEREVIHDLSLSVPKGALVAIVGPTGAGKTTIVNLLMRFYDVTDGEIRLDGHPIKSLTRRSLRRSYSMVLQDTWLFEGTVRENLAYGNDTADQAEIERVSKACGIHDAILSLPNGYETVLDDDGGNISKGQKQLMTIARAMLLPSSLLILDEATSNVDTRTEMQIQRAMRALMADKTCFVIAHRLSTVRGADLILVVRDGEIVERGTHASLMRENTFYKELYSAQFA